MTSGRIRPMREARTELPPPPLIPPNVSAGKRRRLRRNLVICLAYRQGLSQRFLAEAFDLPRSRIAEIIREFRDRVES